MLDVFQCPVNLIKLFVILNVVITVSASLNFRLLFFVQRGVLSVADGRFALTSLDMLAT